MSGLEDVCAKNNIMENTRIEQELLKLKEYMYNFAFSLTLNKSDAEDLLQETFLKVLDNQEKFTQDVNFKGWVTTIMKNLFINNYRRVLQEQSILDAPEDRDGMEYLRETPLGGDGILAEKEISRSIAALPEEYEKPFRMHLEGFKYEEIAQELALPVGTVKSRIFAARKRLQNQYQQDYRG